MVKSAVNSLNTPQKWQSFLDTASHIYKYNFAEQAQIHAQNPQATAVATMQQWGDLAERVVLPDSNGAISLLTQVDRKAVVKVVYDVSGTIPLNPAAEPFKLWEINDENRGIITKNPAELEGRISQKAKSAAVDFCNQSGRTQSKHKPFQKILENSIAYTLKKRCGVDVSGNNPEKAFGLVRYFGEEAMEYLGKKADLHTLGEAINLITKSELVKIERIIANFDKQNERSRANEREQNAVRKPASVPLRPTSDNQKDVRDLWQGEVKIPHGAKTDDVQKPVTEPKSVPTSDRNRDDGEQSRGRDGDGNGELGGGGRGDEIVRDDEVGGTDEQLPSASEGSRDEGDNPQLEPILGSGSVILYEGEKWKIGEIDGDFSAELHNLDTGDSTTLIGNWHDLLKESGYEILTEIDENQEKVADLQPKEKVAELQPQKDETSPYSLCLKAREDYPFGYQIVFTQVGDFYEVYDEDAQILSELTDTTLTSRTVDGKSHDMCGIPAHSLENYSEKLIAEDYQIVVAYENGEVENLDTVSAAKEEIEPITSTQGSLFDDFTETKEQPEVAEIAAPLEVETAKNGSPVPVFFVNWEKAQHDIDTKLYQDRDIIGYDKDGVERKISRVGNSTFITSTGAFWGGNEVPNDIFEQIQAYKNGDVTEAQVTENYLRYFEDYKASKAAEKTAPEAEKVADAQPQTTSFPPQYNKAKEEYPDHIVLTKLGDFYEMFGDDAVTASELLGLTLSNRAGIEVCGFPDNALDENCDKLAIAGHKIAIAYSGGEIALRYGSQKVADVQPLSEPEKVAEPQLKDNQHIEKIDDVEFVFTTVSSHQKEVEAAPEAEEVADLQPIFEPKKVAELQPEIKGENYRITDKNLGVGTPKEKFKNNIEAIKLLKEIERAADFHRSISCPEGTRLPYPNAEEKETLSRYVGWGGLPQAFDENNSQWANEYKTLKNLLSHGEYEDARASTLNAHYTSPTVISAMYQALENMGFKGGNVLEPAMGVGNFLGMMPEGMAKKSNIFGAELDRITGKIAKQLYPNAKIWNDGFEKNQSYQDNFFDVAVGNVPFGV